MLVNYCESMSLCNADEKLDLRRVTLLANGIFRSNIGNYVSTGKFFLPPHGTPDSNPEGLLKYLFL